MRFLLGIDVEDPRPEEGSNVPALVATYLRFLGDREARATFFVVGEAARRFPSMVSDIAAEGHEIACHSDCHIPLDRMSPQEFRDDLRRNRDALAHAGETMGYRAPCFSLTERTRWAHAVLAEEGLLYSSSVLPAANPLYGWPGFGEAVRKVGGITEIPISLLRRPRVPAAGGVYFRVLPQFLRSGLRADPLVGYLHPYDIEPVRRVFAFPGFSRWSPMNLLLFANRRAVLPRLEALLDGGWEIGTYGDYVQGLSQPE